MFSFMSKYFTLISSHCFSNIYLSFHELALASLLQPQVLSVKQDERDLSCYVKESSAK